MLKTTTLESLVRTAMLHRQLSPGVAEAIEQYQQNRCLSPQEQRYLEIFRAALSQGDIRRVAADHQAETMRP